MHVWLLILSLVASEHRGMVTFSGLPVPGATVVAIQGEKKAVAITDDQGAFFFADLPDAPLTIQVDMLGFARVTRPDAGESETLELTMLPLSEIKAEVVAPVAVNPEPVLESKPTEPTTPRTEPQSGAFANLSAEELNQRAADGFLINGSVNNGAASPFAQLAAFGNNRRGRPLYNGGIALALDNSVFDARSLSLTGQDTPKPGYNYAIASFTLGGPLNIPHLIRNGPNFFFSYQRTQNHNATVQAGRVPTLAERSGDLSAASGIVIPQSRISPQATALLNLYPLPNFNGGRYNYQVPVIGATHQDNVQFRINKTIGPRNQLAGDIDYRNTRSDNGSLFGFMNTVGSNATLASMTWFHRFDQRLSTNVRYQFNRTATRTTPYFANRINVSGDAGISGNNQDAVNWGPPSLSFISGMSGLSDVQYSFDREQTSLVSGTTFLNRGRHSMTFGGEFRRQQRNVLSQQEARGGFTFTGAASGNDFADFLLGVPNASSIAFGNADKYFRAPAYAAHFTDDWRLSPGLTLNLGVRWEYEAPMTERYGRLVNLDLDSDFTRAVPVLGGSSTLLRPDRFGIQPRTSFAWRPIAASSLVVRGGYGIYRNVAVYPAIVIQMAQQSPLSRSFRAENSAATPLTLANGFISSNSISSNTFAVDPDFRVGYAHNWTLSLQRDLPASLQVVATYLGSKGSHLTQKSLPNTYPAGASNPCVTCPTGFVYLSSNGSSIRHAGQIQVRRRLHNGFTATALYTLSKSIDDAALGAPGEGAASIAQNWLDFEAERALSNFDQRHALNLQVQYTTGIGIAGGALLSGWRGALIKDWTFTTQVITGSGSPLTPIYPALVKGTGLNASIRPDVTGSSVDQTTDGRHLNPLAYQAPTAGRWGTAGRNSITGPAQFSMDASMGRTFRSSDRLNIDFRLDATNVLNHVTYPSWNTTVGNEQFGLPNRANTMRKVQANLRLRF